MRLLPICLLSYFLLISVFEAKAVDVNVVGLFNDKALVEINGARPRVVSVGQTTPEGVKLISAGSAGAVFEIEGKRAALQMGQSVSSRQATGKKPSVTLIADVRGHFLTQGNINGGSTQFIVDTGATSVAMSTAEARKLGIKYLNGQPIYANTANGTAPAYRVTLDSVRVGDITLNQIDGVVIEGPAMPITLLGMSFLSRVEMKREGSTMTLIKQY